MSIDELCALPVETLAEKDCLLFLWATFPQLPEALRLIVNATLIARYGLATFQIRARGAEYER